ncbi:MAG: hypothetical protein ISR49_21280 [Alphaproteobacteria bacterium]|nr:hypothetical protein [Alphaproteobacteria bacterium]
MSTAVYTRTPDIIEAEVGGEIVVLHTRIRSRQRSPWADDGTRLAGRRRVGVTGFPAQQDFVEVVLLPVAA